MLFLYLKRSPHNFKALFSLIIFLEPKRVLSFDGSIDFYDQISGT